MPAEMCWILECLVVRKCNRVTEFKADAGIIVTASHNPINYNGMKIVKSESRPLDDDADFKVIKKLAEDQTWNANSKIGKKTYLASEAQAKYVSQILKFIDIEVKVHKTCGELW